MSPREHLYAGMIRDAGQGLSDEQVEQNALISYWRTIERETPAKRWFYASLERGPVCRALRIDASDPTAGYAVAPFRVDRDEDGRWRVLAAWPAPLLLEDDPDWLGIEAVVAWDPILDTAVVLGDTEPQLVGGLSEDANRLHSSPRKFFQEWAMNRAQYVARRQSLTAHWTVPPAEVDEVPGALLIGDLARIRFAPSALPEHIECVDIDPRDVNRAIMRAARLPRASAAASNVARAA